MSEIEEKSVVDEDGQGWFNGSLATLERIHNLIVHLSLYRVNHNWLGFKENLGELAVESQGFLVKDEREKMARDWAAICALPCSITDDGDFVKDEALPGALDRFNSWLRLRLHVHGVTMSKTDLRRAGLEMQRKRYKL